MNKWIATLSLATALFAASTLYLGYRLYGGGRDAARADAAGLRAAPTLTQAADPPLREPQTASSPAGSAGGPGTPGPASISSSNPAGAQPSSGARAATPKPDPNRDVVVPFAKQFLARLDDPIQRPVLLEETRTTLRRQYEPLKQKLGLDSATFEQLLTVLAEQQLQPQEKYFRCVVDPACDTNDIGRGGNLTDDRSAELAALLGANNMDDFERYQGTLGEREAVIQLRGRLNDHNVIADAQAEQLVAALSDERKSYQAEATQRGVTVSGWGMPQLGMLFYPGDGNSLEQRFTDAAQYSQRLRQRAATVLSPAQLAAFGQMQDELLASMRATMRSPN